METLKELGVITILREADGKTPKKVWKGSIKKGSYGAFISVEQAWVEEIVLGKITKTNYAGKSFNFPIEEEKALAMLKAITTIVKKGVKEGKEFVTAKVLEEQVAEEFGELGEEV